MTTPPYDIAWTPTARRALTRLPEKLATAAVEFIYGPLAENPQRVGKALRFELDGLHSARRGDYRVIYRISDVVTIAAIEHRADVYR
ncbi:MAG TPA: type II toxin-antitoxin system RelE/ParE family toxin [Candidatus Luteococcus avicola]|nr:type II toxin-antitoxin system RelE/ParE family toxin [Candidatus Luteococcus avicola]